VPLGAPGTTLEAGASQANVRRAHAAHEILRLLGYVDMRRVAAHGHSMGAFVTTALIATYPTDFRVASHSAGGVRPNSVSGPAPSESQGMSVRIPYQLHHGDADVVVPIEADRRLSDLLRSTGVAHELHEYPGAEHNAVSNNATVLARIRSWYLQYGLF
jgi:dipeptidyl aminopeptidase/acylaminoacyl peptidase